MFAFVEGEPVGRGLDYVVVSIGGLGFRVFVPTAQIEEISARPLVKLHTHMAVREDNIALFGMQTEGELAVFRQLISVSGVGPRLALAVLSTWNVNQLEQIVTREDVNALTSVAGIGRKTAQRLLLELKDKITTGQSPQGSIGLVVDAEAALAALGYRSNEVRPIVRALARECKSVEELVRRALSRLAGGE
jgi:Holliday junction DNA helicase RuvA